MAHKALFVLAPGTSLKSLSLEPALHFTSLEAPSSPPPQELCILCFLSLNCSSSGLYLVNAQLSFSSFSDFFYLNHHFLRETYLFLSHFVEFTILITLLFYFFGYSLINLPFFH